MKSRKRPLVRKSSVAAVLVALCVFVGCGKNPVSIDLGGTVRTVVVRGTFANTGAVPTITHFTVSLDGHQVQDFAVNQAVSQVVISGSRPGSGGHHTVRLTIGAQTVSPSSYRSFNMSASLADSELFSSRTLKTVALPEKTASLGTNGQITYDFDL